jgi:hypothetical protein
MLPLFSERFSKRFLQGQHLLGLNSGSLQAVDRL